MQQSINTSASILGFTSSAFEHKGRIPEKYTCKGEELIPPFKIENVDAEAKSLVLVMDDPDARRGMFDHWIKWNIPPETSVIEEGKEPEGVAGKGTADTLSYKGPCPTIGVHGYRFKLYALDTMLDLPEGSTKEELEHAMKTHIIQHTELIGMFGILEEGSNK